MLFVSFVWIAFFVVGEGRQQQEEPTLPEIFVKVQDTSLQQTEQIADPVGNEIRTNYQLKSDDDEVDDIKASDPNDPSKNGVTSNNRV